MREIDLFTNDVDFFKIIRKKFKILNLFTENKKKFKSKLLKRTKIQTIKNFSNYKNSTNVAFCYGFGKIINSQIINSYSFGIWNIHPGDLPKYRGRHPITAAFLNDEKKIGLSIHSIDNRIDMGKLLAKTFVKRNYIDDEADIKKKIFKIMIPLIKTAFKNFKNKKFKELSEGTYHKPFYDGIQIKDSTKEEHIYVYNATKAQKTHGGIFINNKKYYDVFFFHSKNVKKRKSDVIFCKNGKKLVMIK